MKEQSMEELKSVIGRNLTELRHAAGMTQSELAEKLNYSDKAVSKWECGDAVPDILILTRIAALFRVSVDYLVTDGHTPEEMPASRSRSRIRTIITMLSFALVWLVATAAFVLLSLLVPGADHAWMTFICAIPVSSLVVFILCCVWRRRLAQYLFLSVFIWTVLLTVFLAYTLYRPFRFESPWLLFLLGIPGQLIICLWPGLKSHLHPLPGAGNASGSRADAEDDDDIEPPVL